MSEAYNPETKAFEELQQLEIEAGQLAKKRDQTKGAEDRKVIEKQLAEIEERIEALKRRLKP